MVTTQAEVHAGDEIESVHSSSPPHSPEVPPAKTTKRKASKKQQPGGNKRVTVSELSQTVLGMQQSADRQEARVERGSYGRNGCKVRLHC